MDRVRDVWKTIGEEQDLEIVYDSGSVSTSKLLWYMTSDVLRQSMTEETDVIVIPDFDFESISNLNWYMLDGEVECESEESLHDLKDLVSLLRCEGQKKELPPPSGGFKEICFSQITEIGLKRDLPVVKREDPPSPNFLMNRILPKSTSIQKVSNSLRQLRPRRRRIVEDDPDYTPTDPDYMPEAKKEEIGKTRFSRHQACEVHHLRVPNGSC